MFGGRALVDEAYKDGSGSEHGIYQAYKLALFILAAKISQQPIPDNATAILLSQQAVNGGFNTGNVQNGGLINQREFHQYGDHQPGNTCALRLSRQPAATTILDLALCSEWSSSSGGRVGCRIDP